MTQSPTRETSYDAVIIGSGFGSLFFIEGFLKKRPKARLIVLERGHGHDHAWQLAQQRNSALDPQDKRRLAILAETTIPALRRIATARAVTRSRRCRSPSPDST